MRNDSLYFWTSGIADREGDRGRPRVWRHNNYQYYAFFLAMPKGTPRFGPGNVRCESSNYSTIECEMVRHFVSANMLLWRPRSMKQHLIPGGIGDPYELYERYDWGKVPNFMELYNAMELYVFKNELVIGLQAYNSITAFLAAVHCCTRQQVLTIGYNKYLWSPLRCRLNRQDFTTIRITLLRIVDNIRCQVTTFSANFMELYNGCDRTEQLYLEESFYCQSLQHMCTVPIQY